MNIEDITVVIRSSNERTEKACLNLIAEQISKENIFLIHEKPFYKAVKKNFEIGIKQGKKWTLAVDADVLLTRQAIQSMIETASKLGDKLYIYQGYVLDNILVKYREGGPHLYQTKHLQQALSYLTTNQTVLRPESDTYNKMAAEGFIKYVDDKVYGIHDYEQYYKDIFRKAYFHGKKHSYLAGSLVDKWSVLTIKNDDYRVALYGLFSGLISKKITKVNTNFFEQERRKYLSVLNFKEKEPLEEEIDIYFPTTIIESFNLKNKCILKTRQLPKIKQKEIIKEEKLFIRLWKNPIYYLGRLIERVGVKIKTLQDMKK